MRLRASTALWVLLLLPGAFVDGQSNAGSPTILALARAIDGGDASAEETFWQQVAERGTPLVERTDEDPAHVLVTFIWKGTSSTMRVVVSGQLGQLTGTRPADNELAHLARTNVWHRSYWLRKDARIPYQLGVGVSESAPGSALTLGADPLNRYPVPGVPFSLIELPDAPPEPWIRASPDTPKGTVHTTPWRSGRLNN
jgi:enterochelin esterase family protein